MNATGRMRRAFEDPVQDLSIAKANRHKFVWEALALPRRRDVRRMYTQHSEHTRQCPSYQAKEDSGCNVCSASCTETSCEFRCCSSARCSVGGLQGIPRKHEQPPPCTRDQGARAPSLGRPIGDVEVAGGNGDNCEDQW